MNQLVTYCGNAHLQEMYGRYAVGGFRSAQTWLRISFLLFGMMVRRLSQVELERWATVSWVLWNARNKFYFEQVQLHPRKILDGALGFLVEYQHFVTAQNRAAHVDQLVVHGG